MEKLKSHLQNFIKKKQILILCVLMSLIIGVVYSILPHSLRYYNLSKMGVRYVPITQESNFDFMNVHAGRYKKMMEDNIFSLEIDNHEHKDAPVLWPILSVIVLAPFLLITNSVFATVIITDFVFPILIFLTFFLIMRALTEHNFFALISSFVLMLFPQLPLLIPPSSFGEFQNLFFQFLPLSVSPYGISLNYLTRESFIPCGPFFIFFLYLTYKTVSARVKMSFFVFFAGVFYGLSFYLYSYFWIFSTVFLGLFFLILLITKNKRQSLGVFFVLCIGLVISIPFWLNNYHLSNIPNYQELVERMGVEIGHGVKWFLWKTYLLFIAISIFSFWLGSKQRTSQRKLWFLFITALALTGIAVYNINVVTGYFFQSDHWGNKVFIITNGIMWMTLIYYFLDYIKYRYPFSVFKKTLVLLSLILVLSLLSNILYNQIILANKQARDFTVQTNLMLAYEWLDENTPVGSVVASPSLETNIDLSVYSHNKIFLVRSQNTIAPEKELLSRLNITYTLFKITPAYLAKMLQSHRGVFYFFTARYNSKALDASLRHYKYPLYQLPVGLLEEILFNYSHFSLPMELPYRLDYIFIGPREKEMDISAQAINDLEKVYDVDGVQIYKWIR